MCKNLNYSSSRFELVGFCDKHGTVIEMTVKNGFLKTGLFPMTRTILLARVPEVLETQCFNDEQLAFYDEVVDTEIAHLFEHLVLEYICQLKIMAGYKSADHCGRTYWNTQSDNGIFRVKIDACFRDRDFVVAAVAQSVKIIEEIFASVFLPTQTGGLLQPPVYSVA